MVAALSQCCSCALREGCRNPVPPSGDPYAPVMLIGEAPGRMEDKWGKPFVGPSGQELDEYLKRAGMSRGACRVTNVVCCRPPDDRDPLPAEIAACKQWLDGEILASEARVIGTVGAFASKAILGPDFDLEVGHGLPVRVYYMGKPLLVVPIYHPSYGLHSTSMMSKIADDFAMLAKVLRGAVKPEDLIDEWPNPYYGQLDGDEVAAHIAASGWPPVAFVDTETHPDGSPWCVNYTFEPGCGYLTLAKDIIGIGWLRDYLQSPNVMTVLHHAKFDIQVLDQLDIKPSRVADSMVAAYLLQKEPQGLKALAYRKAGMYMKNYRDMVDPYTKMRAANYLQALMCFEWPAPEEELVWEKGQPRIKKPQKISTKVKRILTDMGKNPDLDPMERWYNFSYQERKMVEDVMGPLVPCDLSDIPRDQAIWYAGRDADATARVWPQLWEEVQEKGLEPTFWIDMEIVRMALDMERAGMGIDVERFAGLSQYYQDSMDELAARISQYSSEPINPGSSPQVANLLYEELGITCPKRTGKGAPSTDEEALLMVLHDHPVVKLLMDWRGLQKNKTSFADTIPLKRSRKDGRIHADIKTTRVYTGRLACGEPNLMAMPVRSEEGLKIRSCFVPRPDCSLVSGDYSQIEMRVVAHASQDKEMLRIFRTGEDIHKQTASRIFGVPVDALDDMKHRYPAKRVGFGVMNHLTAEGLLDQMVLAGCEGWTLRSCEELIREWFGIFHGVRDYFKSLKAEARRFGYVKDMFGRRYLLPEMKSSLKYIVEAGERQACSYAIQGGAQGVMKRGMVRMMDVYRSFREMGYQCDPLIQIHDDLVWEVSDEILPIFIPTFKGTMENAVPLTLPLEVDIKTGKDWGHLKKYKEGGDQVGQ